MAYWTQSGIKVYHLWHFAYKNCDIPFLPWCWYIVCDMLESSRGRFPCKNSWSLNRRRYKDGHIPWFPYSCGWSGVFYDFQKITPSKRWWIAMKLAGWLIYHRGRDEYWWAVTRHLNAYSAWFDAHISHKTVRYFRKRKETSR